jgi:hypothetical protein
MLPGHVLQDQRGRTPILLLPRKCRVSRSLRMRIWRYTLHGAHSEAAIRQWSDSTKATNNCCQRRNDSKFAPGQRLVNARLNRVCELATAQWLGIGTQHTDSRHSPLLLSYGARDFTDQQDRWLTGVRNGGHPADASRIDP